LDVSLRFVEEEGGRPGEGGEEEEEGKEAGEFEACGTEGDGGEWQKEEGWG
jgi:hypothetical protein